MGVYEELQTRKNSGEALVLDELSSDELRKMFIDEQKSDYMISEVKESKIKYRRKKYGVTVINSILDEYLQVKSESAKEMNNKIKDQLLNDENISMISKAITHFTFRNGPVEDMHSNPNNQLSETDMKVLNKFLVNRVAYIFKLIIEERWIEFDFLIRNTDMMYGNSWDAAEPDDGGTRKIIEMMLKKR